MSKALNDIIHERSRQDERWGTQNHPDATADVPLRTGAVCKAMCEEAFDAGRGSWSHILVEEVAEAVDEAEDGNTDKLRTELVQVAAVALAWIEAIDRR